MKSDFRHGGSVAAALLFLRPMLTAATALAMAAALAGCIPEGPASLSAAQPRGATVAFESIDGLPRDQFAALVRNLNDEAQSRRLAVVSRDSASAFRVRGYVSAKSAKNGTTVSWVWDVLDGNERRALSINGEEIAALPGSGAAKDGSDAWKALDEAMLRRIASSSMDRLAAFLTSPEVVPEAPPAATPATLVEADPASPEAAGIFRIFRANADPAPVKTADAPGSLVPLPPRRPEPGATAINPVARRSASL